jgi:hypothetical protein
MSSFNLLDDFMCSERTKITDKGTDTGRLRLSFVVT